MKRRGLCMATKTQFSATRTARRLRRGRRRNVVGVVACVEFRAFFFVTPGNPLFIFKKKSTHSLENFKTDTDQ